MLRKLVLGILGLGVVAVVGLLATVASQPDTIHVERSVNVAATPADVAPFLTDMKQINAWSPWVEKDPDLTQTYSDTTTGVGAWYAWEGDENVGSGKQTIISAEDGTVVQKLEFFTPFQSVATATFAWNADGDGSEVTWSLDQEAGFPLKMMGLFQSMDSMIGPDFENGLSKLKPLAEAAAAERIEAEEQAKKAAEAAKAAEAESAEGAAN